MTTQINSLLREKKKKSLKTQSNVDGQEEETANKIILNVWQNKE